MQGTANKMIVASPFSRMGAYVIALLVIQPFVIGLYFALIPNFDAEAMLKKGHQSELFYATLISLLFQALYSTILIAAFQATVGKMAFRLRVIRSDGQPLLPDTAILRALVVFIGGIPGPIELLASTMLLFTDPA